MKKYLYIIFFYCIPQILSAQFSNITVFEDSAAKQDTEITAFTTFDNNIIIGGKSFSSCKFTPYVSMVDTKGEIIWSTLTTDTDATQYHSRARVSSVKIIHESLFALCDVQYTSGSLELWKIDIETGQIEWKTQIAEEVREIAQFERYDEDEIIVNYISDIYYTPKVDYLATIDITNGNITRKIKVRERDFANEGNEGFSVDSEANIYYIAQSVLTKFRIRQDGSIDTLWFKDYSKLIFNKRFTDTNLKEIQEVYINDQNEATIIGIYGSSGSGAATFVKINPSTGDTLWVRKTNSEWGLGLTDYQVKDNYLYATWDITSVGSYYDNFYTTKVDLTKGEISWVSNEKFQRMPDRSFYGKAVASSLVLDQNDNIYLTGYYYLHPDSTHKMAIMKISGQDGSKLFETDVVEDNSHNTRKRGIGLASIVIHDEPYFLGNVPRNPKGEDKYLDYYPANACMVHIDKNVGHIKQKHYFQGYLQLPYKEIKVLNNKGNTIHLYQAGAYSKILMKGPSGKELWQKKYRYPKLYDYPKASVPLGMAMNEKGEIALITRRATLVSAAPYYEEEAYLDINIYDIKGNNIKSYSIYDAYANAISYFSDNKQFFVWIPGKMIRFDSEQLIEKEYQHYYKPINISTTDVMVNVSDEDYISAYSYIYGMFDENKRVSLYLNSKTTLEGKWLANFDNMEEVYQLLRVDSSLYIGGLGSTKASYEQHHGLIKYNLNTKKIDWGLNYPYEAGKGSLNTLKVVRSNKGFLYSMGTRLHNQDLVLRKINEATGEIVAEYSRPDDNVLKVYPHDIYYDSLRGLIYVAGYQFSDFENERDHRYLLLTFGENLEIVDNYADESHEAGYAYYITQSPQGEIIIDGIKSNGCRTSTGSSYTYIPHTDRPVLTLPHDEENINKDSVTLRWLPTAVGNFTYKVYYSTSEIFSETDTVATTNNFNSLTNLESDQVYYWKVEAIDLQNNQATYSDTRAFKAIAPSISIQANKYTLCNPGEDIYLSSNLNISAENVQAYRWFLNDVRWKETVEPYLKINPTTSMDIYVEAHTDTIANQFYSSDSIHINVESLPIPTIKNIKNVLTAYPEGYQYQWFNDGKKIESATDREFKLVTKGYYSVKLSTDYCYKASSSKYFELDSVPPTVTLTFANKAVNYSSFLVQINFSEKISSFSKSDVHLENGKVAHLTTKDSTKFLANIMALEEGQVLLNIPANMVFDKVGNGNDSSNLLSVYYYKDPLTVEFADTENYVNGDFLISILFSEQVKDFDINKVKVSNGSVNKLETPDSINFQATISPQKYGKVSLEIPVHTVSDWRGVPNKNSAKLQTEYDNIQPFAILSTPSDTLIDSAVFSINVSFNEVIEGLDSADFNIENGILKELLTYDSITYTAILAPNNEGDILIDISEGVVFDQSGNRNLSSNQVKIYYQITPLEVKVNSTRSEFTNSRFNIKVEFSQPVNALNQDDVFIDNGLFTGMHKVDSISYVFDIKPIKEGYVSFMIPKGIIENRLGKKNEASELVTITYDATRPTFICYGKQNYRDSTIDLSIKFSEQVNDFTVNDIGIKNGSLTQLFTIDSINFRGVVSRLTDEEVSIDIPADIAYDRAGNGNNDGNLLINFDMTSPVATFTNLENDTISESPFYVYLNLSEKIQNLSIEDILTINAEVESIVQIDSVSYQVLVLPDEFGKVELTIPAHTIQDEAGNENTESTSFSIFYTESRDTAVIEKFYKLEVFVNTLNQAQVPAGLITLYQKMNGSYITILEKNINGETSVSFTQISKGDYTVGIKPSTRDFLPTYLGNRLTLLESNVITLSQDTVQYITLPISPINQSIGESAIQGVLLQSSEGENGKIAMNNTTKSGNAIANVPVYLVDPQTQEVLGFAMTDEDGGFMFNGLQSGSYLFLADYDGLPIDEKQNLIIIESNSETVMITAIAGHNIRVTEKHSEEQITGLEDQALPSSVKVYPNPVIDKIFIELELKWIGGNIKVYDLQGKLCKKQFITNNHTRLDMENMKASVYVITISKEANYQSFKIYTQ